MHVKYPRALFNNIKIKQAVQNRTEQKSTKLLNNVQHDNNMNDRQSHQQILSATNT